MAGIDDDVDRQIGRPRHGLGVVERNPDLETRASARAAGARFSTSLLKIMLPTSTTPPVGGH